MKILTIGSDPEFFVLDRKGNPYPATPFAEGTKELPKPILSLGEGFFEQRDNLSFEGNIPPATTKEEFINNVTKLREYFINKVAKFGCSISINGVESFPKRMLMSPEGCEFGCSTVISSWDSINGNRVSRPTPILTRLPFRVSGFHIHIGYKRDLNDPILSWDLLFGRLFDLFLTIPSQEIKPEPERLKTYGQYGIIRTKTYGVECRTLSTFFTQKEWLPWVWDQIIKMNNFINDCNSEDLINIIDRRFLTNTIDSNFKSIFNNFKYKEVLNKFEETNKYYKNEKIQRNKNNADYHSCTTTDVPYNTGTTYRYIY